MPKLIAAAFAALPAIASAHDPSEAARMPFEVVLALLLVVSVALYATGVGALWRKAGNGRGIRRAHAARFVVGWLALVAAFVPPLDALAERSFAVHMVQHELLMVVAAPLIVLGRPLEAWAWALPLAARRALAAVSRVPVVEAAWRALTMPVGAWSVHAVALWTWHLPLLFVAALSNPALHVLQHACFFASALAFWWAVFGRAVRAPDAVSLACLFTTMLHTSALGALLTFAPSAWYAQDSAPPFGLTTLEDQQLGGLLMWVPGGLAYLVAGLAIVDSWLGASRARSRYG